MRIRRGKIAYIPEVLNGHRHHGRTVRSSFERTIELFEEQLRVKRRLFEVFPVTAGAISGSMARSSAEFARRMGERGPQARMTEHPRLRPHVDDIRDVFHARHPVRDDRRILVVLSGVSDEPESRAAIRRANALAGRCRVFLCNALPGVLHPRAASRLDPRIVPVEGSLGIRPWSWDVASLPDTGAADAWSNARIEVMRELIAFHRIDAIDASGDPARRLVAAAGHPASRPEPRGRPEGRLKRAPVPSDR